MNESNHNLPNGFRGGTGEALPHPDLGPLPQDWRTTALNAVLRPIPKKEREIVIKDEEPYRLLTVRLYAKGLVLRSQQQGKKIGTKRLFRVTGGDFVFSKIDARNGAWGFVPDHLVGGLVSGDFPILRLDTDQADQNFISFTLSRPETWTPLRNVAIGTTGRRRVQTNGLLEVLIPLPPLPEQRAIARVLTAIQRAIEATEQVIAAAREVKKSLMRHLFTYGPVPIGAQHAVPLRETEIGPIPAHWQVVRLGEIFDIKQGKSLSPKHRSGVNPQPFLRTANVYWGKIDLSHLDEMDFTADEMRELSLKRGDLLVCEGGEIGRTAIWDGQIQICFYQNHLHRLRTTNENVHPPFYMYWMQAAYGLLGLYGGTGNKTTIPNLSQSRLKSFLLPLPPLPEQRAIAEMLRAVDDKIQAEENRKAALQSLFQSMLHHLMTGKVRVWAQRRCDPTTKA